MKKVIKIILTVIFVIVLLIGAGLIFLFYTLKSELGDHWKDYANVFAMQTEADRNLPPLENIEEYTMDVQYISKDGNVESRPLHLSYSAEATMPMPVVYVPHYEISSTSMEFRRYIEKGWAVASPQGVLPSHNGQLTDDDLVFNNAALYTLRHMEEIDSQRIAVVGGSAGGYTALMLSGLQMGICATIATSPITNVYFNFYQYFQMAKRNDAPFFLKLVRDSFLPILDQFPDVNDTATWEAYSPVGIAECYSSPFVITHATSDILVPVDQITREFTYDHEGDSMPEGYSTRLDHNNPGVLGNSFVDELPSEKVNLEHIIKEQMDGKCDLPFESDRMFNIIIFDDGPTQSYGSHSVAKEVETVDDTAYLETMFDRGLAENEILTEGKLLLLLERYMGESIQLPAHTGLDDSVYGSLAVYRQEIIEELTCYADNHSFDELNEAVLKAVSDQDVRYMTSWEEISNILDN